jgi:hypothetical protein
MSLVFYEGPSQLDGSTVVRAYLTGHDVPSSNRKTGPMLQTWIMVKDQHPVEAVKDGTDAAVCGSCVHRGDGFANRSCYVTVAQGPSSVWKNVSEEMDAKDAAYLVANKRIRLGAYGNPSAVPFETWTCLLKHARGWTGYEHEWRTCDQRFRRLCMASVESPAEREHAMAMGWRTFRVTTGPSETNKRREVLCPASDEAGRGTNCYNCLLCSGSDRRGKSVAVPVHGIQPIRSAFKAKQPRPASA